MPLLGLPVLASTLDEPADPAQGLRELTGDDPDLVGVTLRDLVASLNALGVGPRDMISILQSIKAAGALQADLEVR